MALLLSTEAQSLLFDPIPLHYTFQDSVNKLTIPQPPTNHLRNSFCYSGAVLWNSLPENLRQAESLSNFKSVLHNYYNIK